jgi:ABC-type branched-subunit amino acid transport system ATPase component
VSEQPVAPQSLLAASGLSAGYNGHPVVRDLDLEVRPGEVVALLGPNGAGKTTTLLTLAGALPAISGSVLIDGLSTKSPLHRRARRGISLITEERMVFPHLSVAENLRVARCDTEHAYTLFPQLRPLARRRGGLLSGGEQQMLALGSALARRPRILLSDELSLGLAPIIVAQLLQTIREVADSGVAVLLVEQHVRQVLEVADRVYVLRQGELVLQGPVGDVAHRLEEAYLTESAPAERGATTETRRNG